MTFALWLSICTARAQHKLEKEKFSILPTVEFETGFTPIFFIVQNCPTFLIPVVASSLYTLHRLTSPCSSKKWTFARGLANIGEIGGHQSVQFYY